MSVHNHMSASVLIPLFVFLQMAAFSFELLLDHLQSLESLPKGMMTSYEALHFGDICFALLPCTLNMQWVSLAYLKSLVNDNHLQSEGIKPDAYSSSTAILIVFLSDEEHECIQHVHISLVVHSMEYNLYRQDGILPFVKSIEVDLAKVRDTHAHKDPGRVCSYALLVASYGSIMAIPTDPPYCLVYPTVYNDDTEDQNCFNTAVSPSGMHTQSYMCCTLLQLSDKDSNIQRTYEGSHLIVPHGEQYWSLFPEIITHTITRGH